MTQNVSTEFDTFCVIGNIYGMKESSPPSMPNTDARIDAALLEIMGCGAPVTHDAVAVEAGVSRRTVYRRFADQTALRKRVWELLSPPGALDGDLAQLLDGGIVEGFLAFDAEAPAMTVTMASAEGRAIRNQMRPQRVEYYRRVFQESTAHLPETVQTQVIAVLQLLCSGLAWREFRDQWNLTGKDAGEAATWAVRALLAAVAEGNVPELLNTAPTRTLSSTQSSTPTPR